MSSGWLHPTLADGLVFKRIIGTGGLGSGLMLQLQGDHTLGRNESRSARLLPIRDYCKLHIITHYPAVLLGADLRDGIRVYPLGQVGADAAGRQVLQEMNNVHLQTAAVHVDSTSPTLFSYCFQYPDSTGGNITTADSASSKMLPEQIDAFFESFDETSGSEEMVLAAPEVPIDVRIRLLQRGKERGSFMVASLLSAEVKSFTEQGGFALTDLLALNIDEARAIAGIYDEAITSRIVVETCVAWLSKQNAKMMISITDGPNGSFGYCNGMLEHIPSLKTEVQGTSGAGDAFLSGIITGLCCGLPFLKGEANGYFAQTPMDSCMELGTLLASMSVTSPHSIHPEINTKTLLHYAQLKQLAWSEQFAALFTQPNEKEFN